jgi:hypothetical protein
MVSRLILKRQCPATKYRWQPRDASPLRCLGAFGVGPLVLVALLSTALFAQSAVPRIPILPKPTVKNNVVDSGYTAIPPADSARMYDSIMVLRRQQIEASSENLALHPIQDAFITVSASVGAVNWFKAPDLNQYFAERANRPDPQSDRSNLNTVDRFLTLGAQFHLTKDIGVFVEYDFTGRYFGTVVAQDTLNTGPASQEHEEHFDATYHTLLTGPEVTLYRSHLLRVKASGGIGAAFVIGTESETGSGVSRGSNATGLAVSFDLATDFHVLDWASFTIDLFSRTISTGKLKTSGSQDLSSGFGFHQAPFLNAPNASSSVFGFSIGAIVYL